MYRVCHSIPRGLHIMNLRHYTQRQNIQNNAHACAHYHRPNEQIVRVPIARTKLQKQIYSGGTRENPVCYAETDRCVAICGDISRGLQKECLLSFSSEGQVWLVGTL